MPFLRLRASGGAAMRLRKRLIDRMRVHPRAWVNPSLHQGEISVRGTVPTYLCTTATRLWTRRTPERTLGFDERSRWTRQQTSPLAGRLSISRPP
jgi:hypothetical protein